MKKLVILLVLLALPVSLKAEDQVYDLDSMIENAFVRDNYWQFGPDQSQSWEDGSIGKTLKNIIEILRVMNERDSWDKVVYPPESVDTVKSQFDISKYDPKPDSSLNDTDAWIIYYFRLGFQVGYYLREYEK